MAARKPTRFVNSIAANFAATITKTRTKAGQTQTALGKKAGCNAATIRGVEAGKSTLETMIGVLQTQGFNSKQIARMVSKAGS